MKRREFLQSGFVLGTALTWQLFGKIMGNVFFEDIALTADEQAVANEFFTKHGRESMPHYFWSEHCRSVPSNRVLEILKYLVSQGADVLASEDLGWTTLHCAAYHKPDVAILKYLVALGADVNDREPIGGYTPLHFAAQYAVSADVITYLVSQGADVNAQTNNGWTPVRIAVGFNNVVEISKCLVMCGAEIEVNDLRRMQEKVK